MRIAFLGLGTMGEPMAHNLLAAGHALTVWNRTQGRAAALVRKGAVLAASPRAAVAGAELVLTMLTDEHALTAVLGGEAGALRGLEAGQLFVEMSTIGREAALAAAREVQARGARFLDAPVSGTRAPAIAGKLLVLVGGAKEDYARAEPALAALGAVRHVGKLGDAAATKLVLNGTGAQMLMALASTLGLARRLGLDPSIVFDTIQAGAFSTPLFAGKRERLLGDAPGADPEFTITLWEKDQRLVLEEAARLGYEMPTLEKVHEVMLRAIDAGLGDEDIAAITRYLG